MPQVEKAVRKERARILREEGEKELQKFYQRYVGKSASILVENDNKGHTENFIPVRFSADVSSNSIVSGILGDAENSIMVCRI